MLIRINYIKFISKLRLWVNNLFLAKFFEKKRIYGLDIVRATAILMVLYEHSGRFIMKWGFAKHYPILHFDGVSIFFVLSGFLIGGITIKTFDKNLVSTKILVSFWLNRWFRTLPNYFFILSLILILTFLNDNVIPSKIYEYFLFIQNFATRSPIFFPEAWSLAVEEWFYLLIPFSLFILLKLTSIPLRLSLLLLAVVVFSFSFLIRMKLSVSGYENWDLDIRKLVITRLDSIMIGVFAAWILVYKNDIWNKLKIRGIFLSIIFYFVIKVIPFFGIWKGILQLPIESLIVFFSLPYFYSLKSGRGLIYKSVTIISILSYSIYLINLTIVFNFILGGYDKYYWQFSMQESLVKFILFWGLSILLAFIPYFMVERPFLKLRTKLVQSSS